MKFNIKPTYYYTLEHVLYESEFSYRHTFMASHPDNPVLITQVDIEAETGDEKITAMKLMKPFMLGGAK